MFQALINLMSLIVHELYDTHTHSFGDIEHTNYYCTVVWLASLAIHYNTPPSELYSTL